MKYLSILDEIEQNDSLRVIRVDREKIMKSLGIDLREGQFLNLSNLHTEELNDLTMKSLTWLERLNEILSTAKKIYMDMDLETNKIFNEQVRNSGMSKATDAKAAAKTSDDYIRYQKKVNLLNAYVDYLERLVKNVEKLHYTFKARLEAIKGVEVKHYAQ